MKNLEIKIVGVIGILALVIGGCLLIPLFINGLSGFTADSGDLLVKGKTDTDLYGWAFEVSGYSTIHHVKNYFLAEYLSTSILYFLPHILYYFDYSPKGFKFTTNFIFYFVAILSNLGFAATWEIVEKFGVFLFQFTSTTWPHVSLFTWFADKIGKGEPVYNTLLNDLPQSIITIVGRLLLVYALVRPTSILIPRKRFFMIILRFCWLMLLGFGSVMISFKKRYGFGVIPWGFYSYFFFEIFSISILYMEDAYQITKLKERFSLNMKELNRNYILTIIYLILQWIVTWNLTAPGFITSNAAFLVFVIGILIWNKFRMTTHAGALV